MDKNPSNIAIGIVHATAILASGANIDNPQKFKIIIGRVKTSAERVNVNAVFISNISGKKENNFSKKF